MMGTEKPQRKPFTYFFVHENVFKKSVQIYGRVYNLYIRIPNKMNSEKLKSFHANFCTPL